MLINLCKTNNRRRLSLASRSPHETSNPDIGHVRYAQVHNWTNEESESVQQTHYFHCNQIGISREMTDKDGNLLWFGNYTGWGRLKKDEWVYKDAHQPFRLQNQYAYRGARIIYISLRRIFKGISIHWAYLLLENVMILVQGGSLQEKTLAIRNLLNIFIKEI